MSKSLKQLEEQALALSVEERAQLADSLLESLRSSTSDIETAWADEIERRIAALDRGEISAYPAEDVFFDARRLTR
ncbi:MAG TPA: addiction module protein [Steroidobacter sp.]|uniref:addiction module protein n=1 Tax=Steroidobacter sp. TaxID=1978227 RepID=UPI002ED7E0E0